MSDTTVSKDGSCLTLVHGESGIAAIPISEIADVRDGFSFRIFKK